MTGPFFDSHCHLQDSRLEPILDAVISRAEAAGVTRMVCCGTREEDWGALLALAVQHPSVIPMLGLHPWYVADANPGWPERLRHLLEGGPFGLGECGLDFALEACDREAQEKAFRIQVRLARELDRPLAIHCRKAWARLIAIIQEEGLPTSGGLVHAFSGSAETARELQSLGLYLSFGGSLTRAGNLKAAKVLSAVRLDRLLLESDAPDLTPEGALANSLNLNEPANLQLIAEAAARLRGVDRTSLARQTCANAMMLFGGLG